MRKSFDGLLLLFVVVWSLTARTQELSTSQFKSDLIFATQRMGVASYRQFTPFPWHFMGWTSIPLTYSFARDRQISRLYYGHEAEVESSSSYKLSDVLGIAFSFPLVPITTYVWSGQTGDAKLRSFALEYTSTLYLTLLEASLISWIPLHERPNQTGLTLFETQFRSKSSFPSGHALPFATLAFKAYEYYGVSTAVLPAALTLYIGYERVRSRRHYLSDVVGSYVLAGFASIGTARAYEAWRPTALRPLVQRMQLLPFAYHSAEAGDVYQLTFSADFSFL